MLTVSQRLQARALLLATLRQFFADRDVLEVSTPLIAPCGVTDVFIRSFPVKGGFLQTSPEYAMKKLLATGSGDIYQICKAFRDDEPSMRHRPEFTLLEWYRLGFDHHDLMAEMNALLQTCLGCQSAEKISYQAVFESRLGFNPHHETVFEPHLARHGIHVSPGNYSKATYLELLFSHVIEPELGADAPVFIYDFPQEQAALAKIKQGVAERFEVYYRGVELANGFHELTDAGVQRQRFEADQARRAELGLMPMEIDAAFITAVGQLPDCAGVALGVDRLLMLQLGVSDIAALSC